MRPTLHARPRAPHIRATPAIIIATALLGAAGVHASPPCRCDGIRRHHGLGEGGNCMHVTGVRRFHGLGDGCCTQWYGWYTPYTVPYPVIVVNDASAAPPPRPIQPPVGSRDRAWWLLGHGRPREAQTEFAVLALRAADDADARAGYALAAAALGRHDTAAWAMRRALSADAAAVQTLALDAPLRRVAETLRETYIRQAATASGPCRRDAVFMLDVLTSLLDGDGTDPYTPLLVENVSQLSSP